MYFKKYKEFIYLFDRDRYIQRRDADKLSRAQKRFIESATTLAWRIGTDKSTKNMFSSTLEGKLGKEYINYIRIFMNNLLVLIKDCDTQEKLAKLKELPKLDE